MEGEQVHPLKSLPIAFLERVYCDKHDGVVNVVLDSGGHLEGLLESEHPCVDVHVHVHEEVVAVARSESE